MKKLWLGTPVDLSKGIPSHDCLTSSVFVPIQPAEFARYLFRWITALHDVTNGQVIAIDGKTPQGSFDKASSRSAIHLVGARATANSISVGQVVTDAKSNENTAVPKVWEVRALDGVSVTIKVMGCPTEIAQPFLQRGGDYVRNVGSNQQTRRDGNH